MIHAFDVDDAKSYGQEEAVILQNIKFWIAKNKANNRHFYEGRTWTYNSIKAFVELFPYWSKKQIERILDSLEAQGVLLKGNFNVSLYDRTTWYAFTDSYLEKCNFPKGEMEVTEWENGFYQTGKSYIKTDIKPYSKPDNKYLSSAKAEGEKKAKKVETVEERELRESIFDFISNANKAIISLGGVSEDPAKYYRQVKKLIEADERITVQVLKDTFNRYFAIRNGFAWRGKTKSIKQFMFSFQEIYQSINNNEENSTRTNVSGSATIAEKRGFTDAVEILRARKYAFTNSGLSPNDIGRQE
jgi:hypothetical protein